MELVSARGGISPLGLESLWGNPEFLKNSKKKKKNFAKKLINFALKIENDIYFVTKQIF